MMTILTLFAASTGLSTAVKQIEGFAFLVIAIGSVSEVTRRVAGAFDQLTGRIGGNISKLNKMAENARSRKMQQSISQLKRGERFEQGSLGAMLGGGVINRIGAHAGAGFRGRFGFGRTGQAVMGANMSASPEEYRKHDKVFNDYIDNEEVMAVVAAGRDRGLLETMERFQGDAGQERLNTAMAAARGIRDSFQSRTAALRATASSGKFFSNVEELNALSDAASGFRMPTLPGLGTGRRVASRRTNNMNYNTQRFGAMYHARQSNNFAAGREGGESDYGDISAAENQLRELGASQYAGIKEGAAEQLFGVDAATGGSAFLGVMANLRTRQAAATAAGDVQGAARLGLRRRSMMNGLLAASSSESTPESSKVFLNETINQIVGGAPVGAAPPSADYVDWVAARVSANRGSTLNIPGIPTTAQQRQSGGYK
ncbi:MAG TPA: hypothetical protein VMB52_07105 [Verrucomicrobiae bacterium]|nr:hypothetical protein [Verrucomicrobiae bacterium]